MQDKTQTEIPPRMKGAKMSQKKISTIDYSIVIPVYFNEGSLTNTMKSIEIDVMDNNPDLNCEIVFVDDGSGDGSLDELINLQEKFPQVIKIIKLSRNFGQHNAISAGLVHASGDCIIVMSADGQDPPYLINDMLTVYQQDHHDIVACVRKSRDESFYRIITSKIFYAIIRKISFPHMPRGGFDFVLISRRVVNVLLKNQEAGHFIQGQLLWTGFQTHYIEYERGERKVGKSRWTFGKKFTLFIDSIAGYSFIPIRLFSLAGLVIAFFSFIYASIVIFRTLNGNPPAGWASLMVVVLAIGGVQMLMLGMMGEYLWRTLAQVRNRDLFIIDKSSLTYPSTIYLSLCLFTPNTDIHKLLSSSLLTESSNTLVLSLPYAFINILP